MICLLKRRRSAATGKQPSSMNGFRYQLKVPKKKPAVTIRVIRPGLIYMVAPRGVEPLIHG